MSDTNNEHVWTSKNTKFLVHLYKQRKDKFLDPMCKKKTLWSEICDEMNEAGYSNVTESALDRKWRNLKKTYRTIKNNYRSNGVGKWKYFDDFEEIFADDTSINTSSPISSLEVVKKTSPKDSTPHQSTQSTNQSQPTLMDCHSSSSSEDLTTTRREKANGAKQIYFLKKKALKIEEDRTNAINLLTKQVERANAIQVERNELLREFLNKFT